MGYGLEWLHSSALRYTKVPVVQVARGSRECAVLDRREERGEKGSLVVRAVYEVLRTETAERRIGRGEPGGGNLGRVDGFRLDSVNCDVKVLDVFGTGVR